MRFRSLLVLLSFTLSLAVVRGSVAQESDFSTATSSLKEVVGHYQETATMWDVVNEALADGDDGYLRKSVYSTTTGNEFIETAFRTAWEHHPDALLIYNDYNCHFPAKRKKLIRLLTELKEHGVPVDAYGMQGHFEFGDDSLDQLRETFAALRELDIQVVVSELDADVHPDQLQVSRVRLDRLFGDQVLRPLRSHVGGRTGGRTRARGLPTTWTKGVRVDGMHAP